MKNTISGGTERNGYMPYKDKEKRNEAVRRYREKRKKVKPPGLVERIEKLEVDMEKVKEDVCLIWKRGSTESDC